MKILRLKSKNINSLKGDNEIDFVKFLNGGSLFAITGETGSGKTTLLDVITCALYGRTARLSKGSEVHELMSRGTAEAMCEVEFEVNKKLYRSSWTIRRARGASDGKVQPTKMELVSLPDATVLESKAREVPKRIEEITGLDFDRFTQSMMLAQGGFDAFLKAEEKERSKLLEKITGTRIYSEISKIVYERVRESREKIELIRAELDGIGCLPGDERKQLKESYSAKKEEVVKSKKLIYSSGKAYDLKQQHIRLLSELEINKKKEAEIQAEIKEKKPLYEKLLLAEKALSVSAIHAQKKEIEKAIKESHEALTSLNEDIKTLNQNIKELEEKKQKTEGDYKTVELRYKTESHKLKKAIELQNKAKNINEFVQIHEQTLKEKSDEIDALKNTLRKLIEEEEALTLQVNGYEQYKKAHETDASLISDIESISTLVQEYRNDLLAIEEIDTKIKETESKKIEAEASLLKSEELLQSLKDKSESDKELYDSADEKVKELEKKETGLKESQKSLEKIRDRLEAFRNDIKQLEGEKRNHYLFTEKVRTLSKQRDELKDKIKSITEHLQTLREKREKELLIQKYEEDRKKLQEGEPCFLCGSIEHPYIEHGEALIFDTDDQISEQGKKLTQEEARLTELEREIATNETKAENAKLEQKKIESRIDGHDTFFASRNVVVTDESEADIQEKIEEIASRLSHLTQLRTQRDTLLAEKDKSLNTYREEEKKRDGYRGNISHLSSEINHKRDIQSKHQKNLDESKEKINRYWQKYGLPLGGADLQSDYDVLAKRKESFESNTKALQENKENAAKLAIEKGKISSKIESEEKALGETKKTLQGLRSHHDALIKDQKKILNVADMDAYAKSVKEAWEHAQEAHNKASTDYGLANNSLKEKQGQLEDKTKTYDEKQKQKSKVEKAFNAALQEKGFEGEQALEAGLISDEEKARLKDICDALDKKRNEAIALKKEVEEKLTKHEENPIPGKDLEILFQEKKAQEEIFGEINRELGEIENRLTTDEKNMEKHKLKIEKLSQHEKDHEILEKLNELIGTADGAKFSKFAQGITLGQLIHLANKHLTLLSDRYAIIRMRNEGQQLELAVIDKYQGDEVRPSNTLSGGESFLVSLSLALGLSELASQKISIDSLFLDEGFGTLDSDTLDTALDALSMLESRGKMVGVISHMDMLKERIPLQISICKNGGGVSRTELVM